MVDDNKELNNEENNTQKDSMDTLPLSEIPFKSKALKNAKLVKNSRMETSVELHSDPLSGSLQIDPKDIADFMEASPQDEEILRKLSELHSFDVYSLRSNLKKLGVEVENEDALELSEDMKEGLSLYSIEFISPLIEKIFGSDREDLKTSEGFKKILRDADINKVKENLKLMAEKTGIPFKEIPTFLEEYSEVFLSVAYYRYSFESIGKDVERFLYWMENIKTNREISLNPKSLMQCKAVEAIVRFILASIRERLAQFHSSFEMFWQNVNKDSFINMRKQIEDNHGTMGSVLCGLIVKMHSWRKQFPNNEVGGPTTRLKFIITEIEPGLENLKNLENDARRSLGLTYL